MDIVELRNVSKRHGHASGGVQALRDVSLTISSGEFVTVTGPSGAGKSTLLHVVAGLDVPDAGWVRVAGIDMASQSDDARSDTRLRHIGVVFQSFHLLQMLSAEENVRIPLDFLKTAPRESRERARSTLENVGLPESTWKRRPSEMSGGEQQRVAIARALIARPQLLLADEPTGNLDSTSGRQILDLLRRQNAERGLTIVLVTHDATAGGYGRRAVELRDGCLRAAT